MVCVCALHGGVTVFVVVIAVRRRRSFFGYFLGVALVSFVGQNCVLIMPVLYSFCLHPQFQKLEKCGAPAVGFSCPTEPFHWHSDFVVSPHLTN